MIALENDSVTMGFPQPADVRDVSGAPQFDIVLENLCLDFHQALC
jgi:hypothetical protein